MLTAWSCGISACHLAVRFPDFLADRHLSTSSDRERNTPMNSNAIAHPVRAPLGRRLAWFAALCIAGATAIALAVFVIKPALGL
jgi:hypothetical protein